MLLSNLSWPDVRQLNVADLVVMLPTGSFEQHGPHLPFTVDSDLVEAISAKVERRLSQKVLLLPTLWPGMSTHHNAFPGTMDVPQLIYIQLISELGQSMARMGARKAFFLNGHGGNDIPLRAALRELKTAVPSVRFVTA